MDQQQQIDKILEATETRIQDEVGGLLGAEFLVAETTYEIVSKETAFDRLRGKQVCARMDIVGEVEGQGCLLIGIKDAIRLGGTLIMLPAAELEEVIGREEYSEEIDDSYGEIANIIAGSFTKDFEESGPESCRFIRKELEVIVPAKITMESDDPVADQAYYQMSCSMVLDGHQMGNMVMLFPAADFGLQLQENYSSTVDLSATGEPADGAPEEYREVPGDGDAGSSNSPSGLMIGGDQERIDRLLGQWREQVESEVGALLGIEIGLDDLQNKLVSKQEFFEDHVTELQILTDIEITGEKQDTGHFSLGIKDAIHLGGTLIMLPPPELESVMADNDFGDDTRDAYGEVTNIIAGVYTSIFEQNYSPRLRFIKKEHQEVSPGKVSAEGSEPIPDRPYHDSSFALTIDGKRGGRGHMLFPAELLLLQDLSCEDTTRQEMQAAGDAVPSEEQPAANEGSQGKTSKTAGHPNKVTGGTKSAAELQKHQAVIDKLLSTCCDRVIDEVSALLGTEITLYGIDNTFISKEAFFFEEVSGNQVIADFDVTGDVEGKSYLATSLRSAIRIGGRLMMLPAAELESVVSAEEFGEDTTDAYGEVANIIAGVYTGVFEEQYSKQLRFVKKSLQRVVPMQVDVDSEEPIPEQEYYLTSMVLSVASGQQETLNLLIPSDLIELTRLVNLSNHVSEGQQSNGEISRQAKSKRIDGRPSSRGDGELKGGLDILLISDNEGESERIQEVVAGMGYSSRVLGVKDHLHSYIPGELKAIYLVMQDVNEQAFGTAIKISSACSVPLIAAGPGWTRSKVIKAVKYGVRDILLTPASDEEIEENLSVNLLQLAA